MSVLALLLAACTGDADATTEAPEVSFLDPIDGDEVTAGDVDVALVVDHFTLQAPSAKHGDEDETPSGWIAVRLDGAEALTSGDTNFGVTLTEEGDHTIEAELIHADGESLEPPAVAAITVTAVAR